jgi:hypothetical protein
MPTACASAAPDVRTPPALAQAVHARTTAASIDMRIALPSASP